MSVKLSHNQIVKIVASICKKLSSKELQYLFNITNTEFSDIILELLYNSVHTNHILRKLSKTKRGEDFKLKLKENKQEILKILGSRASSHSKKRFLRKQIDSGIINGMGAFLDRIMPSISME